jgi:phage shock protein PspC (stress-responsive transcriptional regulator)
MKAPSVREADRPPTADPASAAEEEQPMSLGLEPGVGPEHRRLGGLQRDRHDGLLGGVCAGVAERLGLRPSAVRVAFVAAAALGGIGVIAYLALWLGLPDRAAVSAALPRTRIVLATALALVGSVMLLSWIPVPPAELLWPGLLLGVGAALWQPDPRPERRVPSPPPNQDTTRSGGTPPHPSPPDRPEPPTPRPPQILGRVTVAAALAALGVGLLLDHTDLYEISTYHLVAVALFVLGAGLVVGAFFGRARWLMLCAAPLVLVLPIAGTFTSLDVDPLRHLGNRSWSVPTAASVAPSYENGTGSAELSIGGTRLDGTSGATVVRNGIGTIVVTVPPGMTVELHGRAGWGQITVVDQQVEVVDTVDGQTAWYSDDQVVEHEGRDVELNYVLEGRPGGGTLIADAVIGFGTIEVRRLAPARNAQR